MKSKPLYWEYYWSWCPDQSLASISRVENCLTNEGVEPEGQVFFHGQEAGVMAVGQPLVVLLRTGESWPRVSVLLAKKTVHSQPGQLPRAQWNVKAGVRRFHFTVHASAVVSLWWTLVNQIRVFFYAPVGFCFDILHQSEPCSLAVDETVSDCSIEKLGEEKICQINWLIFILKVFSLLKPKTFCMKTPQIKWKSQFSCNFNCRSYQMSRTSGCFPPSILRDKKWSQCSLVTNSEAKKASY